LILWKVINDKDLNSNLRAWWYLNVAYIPQRIFILDENIYENIANRLDELYSNNNNLTNTESINSAHKKNNNSFIDTIFKEYYKELYSLTSLFRSFIHINKSHYSYIHRYPKIIFIKNS
jgi:ABC-type multidrug transport system fused ATPase/permease subunit